MASVGYTGQQNAPRYTPAPAPRVGGNPYLANILGRQQAGRQPAPAAPQNQPRVQGWNINPATMGNYSAELLARGNDGAAPPPQQQPSPRVGDNPYLANIVPNNQQAIQEEPRVPYAQLPGFAFGGGITTIGEDGGQNPTQKRGVSLPLGGQPSIGGSGTQGRRASGGFGGNAWGGGGAHDTLKSRGATATIAGNSDAAAPEYFPSPPSVNTNGIEDHLSEGPSVDTPTAPSTPEVQSPVNTNLPTGFYSPYFNTAKEREAAAIQAAQAAKEAKLIAENEAYEARAAAKNAAKSIADGAAENGPPNHLSTEAPVQPTYPNSAANIQFGRDAEGQARVDDMRREAASQQSYLDFQQAMRGTDANAAWAQDQMLRAQQEEGINSFAAQYAQGADERNWNRIYGEAQRLLSSADPAQIALGAQMLNQAMPGMNFSAQGAIDAAKTGQLFDGLAQLQTFALGNYTWEELETQLGPDGLRRLSEQTGLSEADLWRAYQAYSVSETDRAAQFFKNTDFYKGLSPDEQALIDDKIIRGLYMGDYMLEYEYNVAAQDGTVTTYATKADADKAAKENGGVVSRGKATGIRLSADIEKDAQDAKETAEEREKRETAAAEEQAKKDKETAETAYKISTGQYTNYKFTGGYNDPVYKAILSHGVAGVGDQTVTTNGSDYFDLNSETGYGSTSTANSQKYVATQNNISRAHSVYSTLDSAKKNNRPVEVDGRLYTVANISSTNGASVLSSVSNGAYRYVSGTTTYVLKDIITGDTKTINTAPVYYSESGQPVELKPEDNGGV